VARWHPFDPASFEYEFNEEKLAEHGVAVREAAEVFWNGFDVRRNKSFKDRYQVTSLSLSVSPKRLRSPK
jgi:uncharacterized DUF497 family protein